MADNGNDTQQFQDALSQLFGRLQDPNQAPPSPAMQPGYPGGPPNPANLPINARAPQVPYQNASQPLPPMPPALTAPVMRPAPSDDPAVTMPTLPTVPSFRSPDLLARRDTTRSAIDQVNAAHANDAEQYKTKWYDRLLGGLTGALVGGASGNGELGGKIGEKVTDRKINSANAKRQAELAPLFNHLNAEKEDEPFYTNADKSDQDTFKNKLDVAKEGREQQIGQGRIDSLESSSAQKDEQVKRLQDLIDHPKTTAPKNADEALAQAYLEPDPTKRQTLMDAAQALHKQEVDRVRESRPAKEDKNLRGTPNQFRGAEDKKAAALRSAEDEFDKATKDIDLKRQHGTGKTTEDSERDEASYQDDRSRYADQVRVLEQKKAAAQDAYKADIRALGGEAEEGAGPTAPAQAAAPSAKPTPTPEQMSQAEGYLKKAGWNGIGKPNDQQKAKARELAKSDGVKF